MTTSGVLDGEASTGMKGVGDYLEAHPSAGIFLLDIGRFLPPDSAYLAEFTNSSCKEGTLWTRLHRGVYEIPALAGNAMRQVLTPHYWPVLHEMKRLELIAPKGWSVLTRKGNAAAELLCVGTGARAVLELHLRGLSHWALNQLRRELLHAEDSSGKQQRSVFREICQREAVTFEELSPWFGRQFPHTTDAVLKQHLTNLDGLIVKHKERYGLTLVGRRLREGSGKS